MSGTARRFTYEILLRVEIVEDHVDMLCPVRYRQNSEGPVPVPCGGMGTGPSLLSPSRRALGTRYHGSMNTLQSSVAISGSVGLMFGMYREPSSAVNVSIKLPSLS